MQDNDTESWNSRILKVRNRISLIYRSILSIIIDAIKNTYLLYCNQRYSIYICNILLIVIPKTLL